MANSKISDNRRNHNFKDITGQRFGRFIVIEPEGNKSGRACWLCLCDCGTQKVIEGKLLRSGNTKSCGCLKPESISRTHKKHGLAGTKIYMIWHAMVRRCQDPKSKNYKEYGARGISVCERWRDFANFIEDMGKPPTGGTLERRDNNKGYDPQNCYWATMREQSNNRRNSLMITYNGKTQTLAQWCIELGITYSSAYGRLRKGWPPERILSGWG